MSKYTIAVLVGSLRAQSYNRQLAQALAQLAGDKATFEFLEIGDLPLYNQDRDSDYPAEGTRLKQQLRAADAVLFVTPEYNRSIPGVLKNAIDTASRPYGDSAFAGKPAAIAGISVGAIGTALAQQHLRGVLAYLTCTCSASRRSICNTRMACSAPTARLPMPTAASSCRDLSTASWPGSHTTHAERAGRAGMPAG